MGSYWGDAWNHLVFNSSNALSQTIGGFAYRLPNTDGSTNEYVNPRYKNVFVHIAKQLVMSEIEGELNKLLPRFRKHIDKKHRKEALKFQTKNREQIITDSNAQSNEWGKVVTPEKGQYIAHDKYGSRVREALMLYYEGEQTVHIKDIDIYEPLDSLGNNVNSPDTLLVNEFDTKTICHIDLAPQVTMNSSKNIVMTKVQGRDYTRKELVSGGDLSFTVNGLIVSNQEGLYPEDAVKKFLQIMQYNGILNVNFYSFGVLGINRIIITSFSLGTPQCKNEQPYSFSCVAVEPDEEIQITKDTIGMINEEFKKSTQDAWYELILDNKLAEMAANAVINSASSVAVQGAGMGLDALVPNI